MSPLGKEIKAQLKRRGWSQRGLAIKAGINQANISRIIRGRQTASSVLIKKIAGALEIDDAKLMQLAASDDKELDALMRKLKSLPPSKRFEIIKKINRLVDALLACVSEDQIS